MHCMRSAVWGYGVYNLFIQRRISPGYSSTTATTLNHLTVPLRGKALLSPCLFPQSTSSYPPLESTFPYLLCELFSTLSTPPITMTEKETERT